LCYFLAASDAQSKELLKVTLDFVTNDDCAKYYRNDVGGKQIPEGLIDAQMCSGVLEGGKDTCQVTIAFIKFRSYLTPFSPLKAIYD
jgi:hypothetical protein